MNKKKRELLGAANDMLSKAASIVEDVLDDERNGFDNLPEGLQESENGEKMEAAIDAMESAIDSIKEASEYISEAQS